MKTSMKKLSLTLALIMIFALAGCAPKAADPDDADQKTVTLTVVHKDGTSKDFSVNSDDKYLGDAFEDENVFSGEVGEFGLFITTADGETANSDNQEWWCVTKGGAEVLTGIDTTEFADGDAFELTLTVGY